MNDTPSLASDRLAPRRTETTVPWLRRLVGTMLAGAVIASAAMGCGHRDDVHVRLHARPATRQSFDRMEIQAQVAGAQAGLRYRWFAISGVCDPQESDSPATVFIFADGVKRDQVSVEVWRDQTRVSQAETKVELDEELQRLMRGQGPKVQVEITSVPPYEQGGPDTRAEIGGTVSGEVNPGSGVVIYAKAYDSWHIQPTAGAIHPVRPDNTWTSWTHTGTSYAALVVRPEFDARVRLDLLPQVGGYVLARTTVEGKKK